MQAILERFDKVCASHGIGEEASAALREVVKAAHRDGWVSATVNMGDDETEGAEVETDSATPATEPDGEEEEAKLRKLVRKAIKKEIKRAFKRHARKEQANVGNS